MIKRNTLRQSGQSLIELMIGLAVISIALTAVLTLTTKSVQITEVSELRKQAVNLARTKLEEIKKARDFESDWEEFKINNLTPVPLTGSEPAKGVSDPGFAWTTDVTVRDADGLMVDVAVTVNWEDVAGKHSVDDYTLLAKWR